MNELTSTCSPWRTNIFTQSREYVCSPCFFSKRLEVEDVAGSMYARASIGKQYNVSVVRVIACQNAPYAVLLHAKMHLHAW
jgi:hypothetical protein